MARPVLLLCCGVVCVGFQKVWRCLCIPALQLLVMRASGSLLCMGGVLWSGVGGTKCMCSACGVLCGIVSVSLLWGSVCDGTCGVGCDEDVIKSNGVQWCVAWHFLPVATVAGVVCEGCEQSTFLAQGQAGGVCLRLGWGRRDGG